MFWRKDKKVEVDVSPKLRKLLEENTRSNEALEATIADLSAKNAAHAKTIDKLREQNGELIKQLREENDADLFLRAARIQHKMLNDGVPEDGDGFRLNALQNRQADLRGMVNSANPMNPLAGLERSSLFAGAGWRGQRF